MSRWCMTAGWELDDKAQNCHHTTQEEGRCIPLYDSNLSCWLRQLRFWLAPAGQMTIFLSAAKCLWGTLNTLGEVWSCLPSFDRDLPMPPSLHSSQATATSQVWLQHNRKKANRVKTDIQMFVQCATRRRVCQKRMLVHVTWLRQACNQAMHWLVPPAACHTLHYSKLGALWVLWCFIVLILWEMLDFVLVCLRCQMCLRCQKFK